MSRNCLTRYAGEAYGMATRGSGRLVLVALATTLAGCGGARGPISEIPEWFEKPPVEDETLFGVGTGTSTVLQIARSMAEANARAAIARQFRVKFEAWTKNVAEQMGDSDPTVLQAFSQVTREIMSEELFGLRVREAKTVMEGDRYTVYALVESDPATASAAMLARMRAQEATFARFRMTEVFDELTAEVERLEQSRRRRQD